MLNPWLFQLITCGVNHHPCHDAHDANMLDKDDDASVLVSYPVNYSVN